MTVASGASLVHIEFMGLLTIRSAALDGNPYVGVGHRWWFVLESEPTADDRADALEFLVQKLMRDLAWVVFPTAGFRL